MVASDIEESAKRRNVSRRDDTGTRPRAAAYATQQVSPGVPTRQGKGRSGWRGGVQPYWH